MVHVHLATLPKTIDEALGKAPRPHGSAAPNSNAPASDVIAPPSKAATTAPRFYQGKIEQFYRCTLSASARPRIGKKLFSQNNFRGFGAPMRSLVCEISLHNENFPVPHPSEQFCTDRCP
jgi:hypothetical protein